MAKNTKPPKKMTPDQMAAADPDYATKLIAAGQSYKLSDKYLPADLLAIRKKQREKKAQVDYLNNLGDVTKPLTGETLVDVANRTVNSAYAPQESQLAAQLTGAGNSGRAQATWSQDYDKFLNGVGSAGITAQNGLNAASIAQRADARRAAIAGIDRVEGDAVARAAADAAVRGDGLSGGSEGLIAQSVAQARVQAAAQGAAQDASALHANGAQSAILQSMQGVQGIRGREAQDAIRTSTTNQEKTLTAGLRDLASKKGDDVIKTISSMRSDERQKYIYELGIKNQAEQAILKAQVEMAGIKSKEKMAAAERRLKNKLTLAGYSNEAAIAAAKDAVSLSNAQTAAGATITAAGISAAAAGGKGLTKAQRRTLRSDAAEWRGKVEQNLSMARGNPNAVALAKQPGGRGLGDFGAYLKSQDATISASQIRATWDLLTTGLAKGRANQKLSGVTLRTLKAKGFKMPKGWPN